jgi:hypothetical protein
MSSVNSDRFCPLCEQIIPTGVKGIMVKIGIKKVMVHPGCAEAVVAAEYINRISVEDPDQEVKKL